MLVYVNTYIFTYINKFSLPLIHTAYWSPGTETLTYISANLEVHAVATVLGNQRKQKEIF